MPREEVPQDEFLARLEASFASSSKGGDSAGQNETVWLTHKRYTHEKPSTSADGQYDVLVRCTHGVTKFSTRIPATALPGFLSTYSSLLKASMAPRMRKRDKKKEKARAEELARKRKELYVDVHIGNEGKRGKGHRQRQRKVAAQKKKEVERERLETRQAQAQAQQTQSQSA